MYDRVEQEDGFRVLVDRLWPRGLSKEAAAIDLWAKDVAPSTELRRAWHARDDWRDGSRFDEFRQRYRAELSDERAASALAELQAILREHNVVTLLTSSKHPTANHAAVLEEILQRG